MIAMTFLLKGTTGTATEMAKWTALASLPGLFVGIFAGSLVDRKSRVSIIIACNFLAGITSLALGVTGILFGGLMPLGVLLSAYVVMGVIRSFFTPAFQAAIPDLVSGKQLKGANSLLRSSAKLSDSGGQILSGVIYSSFLGSSLLFLSDGLSYLFAGLSSKFISPPENEPSRQLHRRDTFPGVLRETKEALLYVKDRKGMRDLLIISCALNLISAPIIFLLPFYTGGLFKDEHAYAAYPLLHSISGSNTAKYGILMACTGIGAVIGHLLVSAELFKGKPLGWILSSGLLLGHLLLAAIGFATRFWMAVVLSFASSIILGVVMVYLITLYQDTIQEELRGRIFSLSRTLGEGLLPVGIYLGGMLYDQTGKSFPLIFGGVGILSALAALGLFRRECREFLAQARGI